MFGRKFFKICDAMVEDIESKEYIIYIYNSKLGNNIYTFS